MNKKIVKLLTFALLIGVFASGCTSSAASASSWPGFTLSEGTGYFSYGAQVYALDEKNGSLIWQYPQEANSSLQFYAAPEVGSDLVIVGDYSNTLTALDKQSGFEKWQFTAADDRYIGSALLLNGYVYAPNTDHYLYVLDENGDLKWRFKANGPNWTKPMADEEYLYLVSMDHFLYVFNFAYDTADLAIDSDGSRTLVEKPLWSLDFGSAVVANPVIEDGVLYAGTIDGTLYAVNLEDQAILWSYHADNTIASLWGSPVLTTNSIFFGDADGNVYAVNKKDGTAIWPTPFAAGSSVISGGVSVDEKVIFATTGGKIFSIDENKEPKTLVTLDAALYSSLGFEDEKIILAPASSDVLFEAIDANGNNIWTFSPTK
jgi:outer membrane protein assembly factor BamB